MNRKTLLLVVVALAACTADQPTEPTRAESPLQAVLGPPPADVSVLSGTLQGANGAPTQVPLGVWESPALARITVSGLLSWSSSGTDGGYYPVPGGQLNYLGRYIPSGNLCASQVSVRVLGYGAVGGGFGNCPSYWQTVGSVTNYAIVSGQIVAVRNAPAPGSCYYGGTGCTTITGEQTVTVEPIDGDVKITLDRSSTYPSGLIVARFTADPEWVEDKQLPFTLREVRFEGSGPILGGGTTTGCTSWSRPNECSFRLYQSGYLVAEAIVSGKLKTQRQWLAVQGGDSLPPVVDTLPTDTIPTDTIPGGGGGVVVSMVVARTPLPVGCS